MTDKTDEIRDARGRFATGNPGKPKGARHAASKAAEALLDGEVEKLTRKAIELALEGDTTALRLCLERLLPPQKSRLVSVALPAVRTPADVLDALGEILRAVSEGELTTDEAKTLAGVVELKRRAIETVELEARIARLEDAG